MNYELPKPVREVLARQMAHDAHPSADVLTAFAEQLLHHDERQRVIDHLAQCTECREVVFLASNAVEEPVGEEQKLAAAAARPLSPAVLAKPVAAQAMGRAASVAAPRRSRWQHWWVWVPAVAVVLVVAGVVVEKRSEFDRSAKMMMASKGSSPVATTSEQTPVVVPAPESENQLALKYKATPERRKPLSTPARAPADQNQSAESLAASSTAFDVREKALSATAGAAAPPPASPVQFGALAGAAKVPAAAPTHNSFVESEGQTTTALLGTLRPTPQMATYFSVGSSQMWRVLSDGHLERSTTPGNWTPVLADQPTTFHVVSVVGNNVWAGGSSGALFHSSDSGETWSKQPLAGETGTIVSIHFSDAAHGIITTDGGARWSTSDGGVTWIKG